MKKDAGGVGMGMYIALGRHVRGLIGFREAKRASMYTLRRPFVSLNINFGTQSFLNIAIVVAIQIKRKAKY
jgi:hypothetical protein